MYDTVQRGRETGGLGSMSLTSLWLLLMWILSLHPSRCVPALTPSAITLGPTIPRRPSNPLSAFLLRLRFGFGWPLCAFTNYIYFLTVLWHSNNCWIWAIRLQKWQTKAEKFCINLAFKMVLQLGLGFCHAASGTAGVHCRHQSIAPRHLHNQSVIYTPEIQTDHNLDYSMHPTSHCFYDSA